MASENITFDNIPTNIRIPGYYSEYDLSNAVQSLPENAQKVAILAQKTSSGSGTANTAVRIFSESDAILYAGTGSVGHLACRAMLKANPDVDLDLVPISDGAGTDSTGSIVMSGADSTYAGSIVAWVGNTRVEASIAVGDGPDDVASSLYAALNDSVSLMPTTITYDSTNTITLVARNYGTLGNNIPVSYKISDQCTDTTATVTQPTGGATDPSIETALTNIYPADYNLICCTLNNSTALGLLKTHLNNTDDPQEGRPGMGVFGYTDNTQATLETLCGTTLNSGRLTCGYIPYAKTTERGHSLDYEVGAAYCGVIAKETDPAMPLNRVVLTGIAPNDISERFSRSEKQSALENGITPLIVIPGEQVAVCRAITTYTTNAAGFTDTAQLDINPIRILDYTRKSIETRFSTVFARTKITERTMAAIKTQIISVLLELQALEILENVDANIDKIIVERDLVDKTRVNCSIPADVVNALHIIADKIVMYL